MARTPPTPPPTPPPVQPPASLAQPATPPQAPGGEPAADPSMEDILASIRRILNEDEAPPGPGQPAHGHDPAAPAALPQNPSPASPPSSPPFSQGVTAGGSGGDDGILMLDEAMLVPAPSPQAAAMTSIPPPVPVSGEASRLLAPEAEAAASSSVQSLMRTLTTERTTPVFNGGPSLEDLVRDEVRPLLKAWLDQHLPPLVERVVQQEIARITSHRPPT